MSHGILISKDNCPKSLDDKGRMRKAPYASAIGSIIGDEKLVVKGYTDNSFQTDKDDSVSQSGFVFCFNGGVVRWKSSKQETVADSTMKAEYIVASEAAKEAVLIRKFITGLGVVPSITLVDLYYDNNGAIAEAKEPRSPSRAKHILGRYHLLREINKRGDIHICKVHTDDNVTDPLTKALSQKKHEGHTSSIETLTKPTKTEEPPKTQIQSRYETIRVPILRPSEYAIWKVRMTMFLEATDPEYLDRIKEGPHKPTKLAVAVAGEAAKTVPKEKSDYTAEDIASIAKDAKDLKATTIRDNYNLDETTLDEIYGMLKTHELEMEQRSKRKGGKSRTVALKAEEESPKAATSRKDKGKALFTKSDTESSSSESDDDSESESLPKTDADEEMMKLCALMVKGITKIAYRKFRKGKKFSRKGTSSDKKNFRRSEGRGGKSDRGDYTNVKCYNCGEKDHISPDCKKVKSDKGKALVTKKKSWTDTSDSESEENYTLMANADKASAESSSEAAESKVPQTTYAFHTDDINELRRYLKTMDEVLKMIKSLKTELEKEREVIRTLTNSGRTTQNLLSSEKWKEGLGYGEDKNDKGTVKNKPVVVKQKPKLKPVKFVAVKSDDEKSKVKKD
ncbi:hypothetical protein AgCh_038696 [Apium graveolens]